MAEMIECLSEAEEFLDFKPRNDQKRLFEEANKKSDLVRYKIEKKVNTGGWTGVCLGVSSFVRLAAIAVAIQRAMNEI